MGNSRAVLTLENRTASAGGEWPIHRQKPARLIRQLDLLNPTDPPGYLPHQLNQHQTPSLTPKPPACGIIRIHRKMRNGK